MKAVAGNAKEPTINATFMPLFTTRRRGRKHGGSDFDTSFIAAVISLFTFAREEWLVGRHEKRALNSECKNN